MKKINVIGLGYIGLPTSAMFASHGVEVVGVDISEDIVNTINKGEIHIEEPGLRDVVHEVVAKKMFRASIKPEEAEAFIVAVPTPSHEDEYLSCNIDYVVAATKSILPYLKKGNLVIIESTIAPRTTEDYILPIIEDAGFKVGEDIFLTHCPERVLPGQIMHELINNNRIIGGITEKCADKAADLYKTFVKGELIVTEAKTAEMSKLMENTFRDVNIALANELTKICNKLDINVLDVIEMANKHPRVNIHQPGPGVGGHCLAIDPYFIYSKAPELAKIIKLSRDTNRSMPGFVIDNVEAILNNDKSKTISALGVTYKPNVDDLRESPALEIINTLKEKGYNVLVHDPHAKSQSEIELEQAIKVADLLLCLVAHNEFKNIDDTLLEIAKENLVVLDTVNCIKNVHTKKLINYGNLWSVNK